VRWAIAGRDRPKLEALGFNVPIVIADAQDAAAIDALARQTRVVCTTVGPYARYGSELVAACARAGTHYCDLTGEPNWMRQMIDAHDATARASGARIVHACGYDSIPSDIGTWAVQQAFRERFGSWASQVTALFGETSGSFSGGTVASALTTADAAGRDPAVRANLRDPHGLDPDATPITAPVPDERRIGWNAKLGMFTIPFVMAQTNTRVVRRSHALAGFPWGRDFRYREVMSTPGNARGLAMAVGITAGLAGIAYAMRRPRLRDMLARRAPQPGQGPSAERRARGHWKARFLAERGADSLLLVAGDRAEPGYGSTCTMLGQSAICLARDPLTSPSGVTTPSIAMGDLLLGRLRRAGLKFEVAG
jgi:short subunit dehydrogenase-like uncharacterized protein